MLYAGGTPQYYNVDPEPVWQPQPHYRSAVDSSSSTGRHPSVNGARYVDDGYGGELDSSGQFDIEPGFTQQQVNGACCIECVLFQNLTNLDRSRFVRRDRSSPVKKNTLIFLVVVGMVSCLRTVPTAPQTTPSFTSKHHGNHEYS